MKKSFALVSILLTLKLSGANAATLFECQTPGIFGAITIGLAAEEDILIPGSAARPSSLLRLQLMVLTPMTSHKIRCL